MSTYGKCTTKTNPPPTNKHMCEQFKSYSVSPSLISYMYAFIYHIYYHEGILAGESLNSFHQHGNMSHHHLTLLITSEEAGHVIGGYYEGLTTCTVV
jgi:hypothetical protein